MAGGTGEIRLMTFNVCGLPSRLAPLPDRAAEFGARIEDSDVDLVNFQEVFTRRAAATLRSRLPSFPYQAWRPGPFGPAGGLLTLSRLPLGRASYRSFRGVVPRLGGPRFRAKRAVNSLLQGVLTVELPGRDTVVVNTHLTANKDGDWSAANRYHAYQGEQLDRLHARLRGIRSAPLVLVSGDFNIASDCALYPRIVSGSLRDPFAGSDLTTYHSEFLPDGAQGHRIDYLLVRGDADRFPVLSATAMFTAAVRRMFLSDHVALTARIGVS